MALTFDHNDLPVCCGIGLIPGDPHTACPRCYAHFNTQELAEQVRLLKLARQQAAQPDQPAARARAEPKPGSRGMIHTVLSG